ncbi:MAG: hypothetical protein KGJ88_09625 [Verrucomicrobiota bacterium]|nr:hypothetical protein [Verrucomicrobiota bacterium]
MKGPVVQRIIAISGLTWKAAIRFRLFLVVAVLLVLAVAGLPLVIESDGTARGFAEIILTYTLSVTTALLGLCTLWLACGTLARDIEECQMQVVASKPVARWQIWIGKWLGIVTLDAALLILTGGCIYGLMEWRAASLPAAEQKNLREQVLVARGAASPPGVQAEIEDRTAQILAERLKQNPGLANLSEADKADVVNQIRSQVESGFELVPPGYSRQWRIHLGVAKDFLRNKPMQLKIKFNSAGSPYISYSGYFAVGDPTTGNNWQSGLMTGLAPGHFHEFSIPANLFDTNGIVNIVFSNPNDTALLFPTTDGIQVLYPEGGFAMNFARALGVIFCWMALLAALGLAAASFLSFPVAAFVSLSLLLIAFSSGTLFDAVAMSGFGSSPNEVSIGDRILIPLFKGILAVTDLTHTVSPIDRLSTGYAISWTTLGVTFLRVVLVLGGVLAVAGIAMFYRRELAAAQSQ